MIVPWTPPLSVGYFSIGGLVAEARRTVMTVRSNGSHGRSLADAVNDGSACDTVGASSHEQIRLDKERTEQATFEQLKAALQHAFAAPEESYRPLTAAEVIDRNG